MELILPNLQCFFVVFDDLGVVFLAYSLVTIDCDLAFYLVIGYSGRELLSCHKLGNFKYKGFCHLVNNSINQY